jgi:acyl-CoA thioester hydrolase
VTKVDGVEVWRGTVNTWECDEMGHMNVRFYVARAVEGVAGLAFELGMAGALRARSEATLLLRWLHIRFLKEARAGAPLHLTAGLLDVDEAGATVLLELLHSKSGEPCAAMTARVLHATARGPRLFPWSERLTAALDRMGRVDGPAHALPKGVTDVPEALSGSVGRAGELGLPVIGRGTIDILECDVFGRWRADAVMGRLSDAATHLFTSNRGKARAPEDPRIGGAMLECRLIFARPASAGDHFVIRSGISAVTDKIKTRIDWILDPASGAPWAGMKAVAAAFDLDARRIYTLNPEQLRRAQAGVIEGLTL